MIIYLYIGNTYIPMLLAVFSTTLQPPAPPPPPPAKFFFFQIWILCQNPLTRELKIRVVRFVLKKLLTFFEMLIVPHALHCIDGCFLPHFSFDSLAYCFGLSTTPPPPPPKKSKINKKNIKKKIKEKKKYRD